MTTDTTSWTVRLDAGTLYPLTDEQVSSLLHRLAPHAGAMAVDDAGRLREVTLSIDSPHGPLQAAQDAVAALDMVTANIAGDILTTLLVGLEVITADEQDRRLSEPAYPELVGVTEIAKMLGVSRQRASALQTAAGFPHPLQVLASGPVWPRTWVERFAETWERKGGRPRKPTLVADGPLAAASVVVKRSAGDDRASRR